ncbi:MAG: 16S rRNA (cytosine(1402)-N(4))-methyltransferase RsmH [Saprospiraceae bacterium]|nr:16S rRNA (cytosine(1402)-N(4))-methyltransferase RsmH [Saprospiraceae bacterium]
MTSEYHVPVLLKESMDYLIDDPAGIYVDVTYGAGGHARAILTRLNARGQLVAFDRDLDALENKEDDARLRLVHSNFAFVDRFLRYYEIPVVDGVFADLGVSSHQFDEMDRGFSYFSDADLDMRMNQNQDRTAAAVINTYSGDDLVRIFSDYGQIRNAKTLAGRILEERNRRPISRIPEFIEIIQKVSRGNPIRYQAQIFQAIRIEVNDEIGALRKLLQTSAKILRPGGSLVVLTYHSVEDRLVKHFMKGSPGYGDDHFSFEVLTRKPVLASDDEIKRNPRASSAKLRAARKK